jgi:hypothetical protein
VKFILIQLRNSPEEYFWLNAIRLKRYFPDEQLCIISDNSKVLKKAQELGYETWQYARNPEALKIFSNHGLPSQFREGFWQVTSERLFALTDYVISEDPGPALLIESDVLLMQNFPIKEIKELKKLHWCNFNSDRDVAALLYIPNSYEAKWLSQQMLHYFNADNYLTDMTVLRKIASDNPLRISYFRTASDDEVRTKSEFQIPRVAELDEISQHLEKGIFDGAAVGMWLTGEDPRNNKGFLIRHRFLADGNIDLRDKKFKFRNGDLFLTSGDLEMPVFNLHIHSKRKQAFGNSSKSYLEFLVHISNWNVNIPIFFVSVFLKLALNRARSVLSK